jgi:hypothetical protein
VEKSLADAVGVELLGMRERRRELHAERLCRDVRRELLKVEHARIAERMARKRLLAESLQPGHAGHQPRLEILDPVGIGEIARQ